MKDNLGHYTTSKKLSFSHPFSVGYYKSCSVQTDVGNRGPQKRKAKAILKFTDEGRH